VIGYFLKIWAATLPSVIATPFFVSAYVHDVVVPLPTIPLLPWAFFGTSALIVVTIVAFTRPPGPVEE